MEEARRLSKESSVKDKIKYAFWYFVIFSILGLIIETIFCYVTMGILESRKGLLIGPFCPIYGVGGAVLIFSLEYFKKDSKRLFIVGFIVGSIVEYALSFIMEAMYGSRFWDYSHVAFNLNGRICITYSLYWGVLSILLMRGIKPKIDLFINKIPCKIKNKLEVVLFIFLIFDLGITIWGINMYVNRSMNKYLNNIKQGYYSKELSGFDRFKYLIEDRYFTNERMLFTFPNLRCRDEEGKEIFVRDIVK